MGQRTWTERADALLEQLCSDRRAYSTSTMARIIGEQLGIPVSRNAAQGRARRRGLRLPIEPSSPSHPKLLSPDEIDALIRPKPDAPLNDNLPLPSRRQIFIPETDEPGLFLINAGRPDCRFPVSGEGLSLRVCGNPVARESDSYCAHCRSRAFGGAHE